MGSSISTFSRPSPAFAVITNAAGCKSIKPACAARGAELKKQVRSALDSDCMKHKKKEAKAPGVGTEIFFTPSGATGNVFSAGYLKSLSGSECLLDAKIKTIKCEFKCTPSPLTDGKEPLFDLTGSGTATVTATGGKTRTPAN
jgi:hypothetical protein